MNHIILCEGSSDFVLIQYYMRKAYQWDDDERIQGNILKMPNQRSRNLAKNGDILTIMSVGGCGNLVHGLKMVLERNFLSQPDLSDAYKSIVMITDRDEVGTEQSFLQKVTDILSEYKITYNGMLANNFWLSCQMSNQIGISEKFSILPMIIPFEENGAMETFLLNAICESDSYDKTIIDKCSDFVDHIDPEKKYLSSRRYIIKAKFDTYFSVRTPLEQFVERGNILQNIPWEQYTKLQTDFGNLGEL